MMNRKRLGISYVIGHGPIRAREIVDSAVLAEKSNFTSVFMPEHYYDRESPSILGAIARSTSKVKIGTGVINPYTRYPSLIAMMIATLDEISQGRAILGLGSGGVIGSLEHGIPNEFANQKYEYPLGHLKEVVEIVRRLLVGERVTFHGKHYSLNGVKLHFKPIQERIPIYFGQQGPKMMELAGEVADGVLMTLCGTIPYIKDVIRRIKDSAKRINRSMEKFDFAARIITSLSDDPKRAIKEAKPLVGRVFIHPGSKPVMELSSMKLDLEALKRAANSGRADRMLDLVPDEVVEQTTASGTRRQVLDRIEDYRSAGVTNPLIVALGKNYSDVIRAFASTQQ